MAEPLRHAGPPDLPASPPSLWREIADGSAGAGVRVAVSLALAGVLSGAACFGSYVVAGIVPQWAYVYNGRFRPTDELVGCMFVLAGAAFIAGLIWIWSRSRLRMHEFAKAGMLTAAVSAIAILLGIFIEEVPMLRMSDEVLLSAVLCFGGAAVILIWVQAARRFVRGKPLRNATDGSLDLRCPTCGYRMVGLRECRCPECGTAYTLDELLLRQEFLIRGAIRDMIPPAIPERASNNRPHADSASSLQA